MYITPGIKYSKEIQKELISRFSNTQTATRIKFLFNLPMYGRVAEIGVAQGNFSECILKISQPRELHLIDCWKYQSDPDYRRDCNDVAQNEQDRRFRFVKKRFKQNPQVKIHREYSDTAADSFPNHFFDWIYLDANHGYEAVKTDLVAWYPKVKKDGVISGNDYTSKPYYGVIAAVDQFAQDNGLILFLLDNDPWHSWALAKPETINQLISFNIGGKIVIEFKRLLIRNSFIDHIYTMAILRLRAMKIIL